LLAVPTALFCAMNDRAKEGDLQRRKRLSAALRENLKRRKAQIKGRAIAKPAKDTSTPHDSAEIIEDK
jgi:hypothetical protein